MGREGNTSRGWEDEIRQGRQLKKEAVKLVIMTGNWSLIPQGKLSESEENTRSRVVPARERKLEYLGASSHPSLIEGHLPHQLAKYTSQVRESPTTKVCGDRQVGSWVM